MSIGKLTETTVLEYESSLYSSQKYYPVGPYYDLFLYRIWDCYIYLASNTPGLKYKREDIYEVKDLGDIVVNFASPRREWILR